MSGCMGSAPDIRINCSDGICRTECPDNCPSDAGPPDVQDGGPLSCGDGGYYDEKNRQCVDVRVFPDMGIDGDAYIPPEMGTDGPITPPPDAGPDGPTPPPPGVNFNAATFTGQIVDIDAAGSNGFRLFGGSPAKVRTCNAENIEDVTCQVRAEFIDYNSDTGVETDIVPSGSRPIDYFSTGLNFGLAVFAAAAGNPILLARVNETGSNPRRALQGHDDIETFGSGGWFYNPAFPGGVVSCEVPTPTPVHNRFFVPTANNPVEVGGTVLHLTDQYGFPIFRDSFPTITDGLNSSSVAMTNLTLGREEAKPTLLVLNACTGELAGDECEANIVAYDPVPAETPVLRTYNLGPKAALPTAELQLDPSGTKALVIITSPEYELMIVDLETSATTSIPLDVLRGDPVQAAASEDGRIFVADSNNRIWSLSLGEMRVLGYLDLPGSPTAISTSGNRLAVSYTVGGENKLAVVNLSEDNFTPVGE